MRLTRFIKCRHDIRFSVVIKGNEGLTACLLEPRGTAEGSSERKTVPCIEDARMAALVPELFHPISDPQRTRAIFKACVERVMVETSSYCNRRCSYCPTAQVAERFAKRDYMPDTMRDKIAAELAEI